MKHQQNQLASKRNFVRLAAVVAMLALMVCCTVLWVNAAPTASSVDLSAAGITLENGYWVKTYDGSDAIDVSKVKVNNDSEIVVTAAKFNSANVGDANAITIEYTKDGASNTIVLPAKINPKQLTWSAGGKVEVVYDPAGNGVYEGKAVDTTGLTLNGVQDGDEVSFVQPTVSFVLNGYQNMVTYADVELSGSAAGNYTVAPLTVSVVVKPIEITAIEWIGIPSNVVAGDRALLDIKAIGNGSISLIVKIQIDDKIYTLSDAYLKGYLGGAGNYTLIAEAPNALYTITAEAIKPLTVKEVVYNVVLNDREFLDSGDLLKPENAGFAYQLVVESTDGAFIPQYILSQITYKYFDAQGKEVDKVTKPGVYTVKATMPQIANVSFNVTALEAKMTVVRNYLLVSSADGKDTIMIVGQNGIADSAVAKLTLPESFARTAVRGLHAYKGYTLSLEGVSGEFTLYIPVSADILSAKNCAALTADNLYIYNSEAGTKEAANAKYTVTLSEDGSYYIIEGYSPAGKITFMIAPDYDPTFFASPIGIALIVMLALILLLFIPMLVGMKLVQIENSGRNPVITVETEGNVPEFEPVVISDKIDDPDAVIEEGIDGLVDALMADTAAATDETDVDATDAVAEAMADLNADLAQIDLAAYDAADIADAENAAMLLADELVRGLMDEVGAEENAVDVSDDVAGAVADAMAENFNESADATDAIALIDEEVDEMTPEFFRDAVDAIVAESMTNLLDMTEVAAEVVEEAVEETVEETVEEAVVEEAAPEVVEEESVQTTEEAEAVEAVEEAAEEAVADEGVEEPVAEEEIAVCVIVADSVAEAFDAIIADGMVPTVKEGTTRETIVEAVNNAAAAYAPASWTEEMIDEVKAAVVEELAARLLVVEEPVEEVLIEEELIEPVADAEAEDNDEDDDDSFGGFGSMPLDYIDAIADEERYAEMLEQERRGEVQLVTRYRRSYLSRLAQSQGSIQDYYNVIKNLLLSYKGVKNRISWNFESFNVGRTPLAKFNAKTRTLYVYIALSPEELVDSKYNFTDMSAKKKYAAVPVLLKVKGERKFKHAIELFTMLCEEKLQLPKKKTIEEIDYRMPFKTTEELVQEGAIKMMVAAIPVDAPAVEEVAVEAAPVEEIIVEQTPVEEVVVEEAVEGNDQNA